MAYKDNHLAYIMINNKLLIFNNNFNIFSGGLYCLMIDVYIYIYIYYCYLFRYIFYLKYNDYIQIVFMRI